MDEFKSPHMIKTLKTIKALLEEGRITLKGSRGLFQKAKAASVSGMTDTECANWLNMQHSEIPADIPQSQSHARQIYQNFSASMIERYFQNAQAKKAQFQDVYLAIIPKRETIIVFYRALPPVYHPHQKCFLQKHENACYSCILKIPNVEILRHFFIYCFE